MSKQTRKGRRRGVSASVNSRAQKSAVRQCAVGFEARPGIPRRPGVGVRRPRGHLASTPANYVWTSPPTVSRGSAMRWPLTPTGSRHVLGGLHKSELGFGKESQGQRSRPHLVPRCQGYRRVRGIPPVLGLWSSPPHLRVPMQGDSSRV